jgi:hypothetical protein
MTKRPLLFPPITPEHAAAIGYVAVHWSLIEEFLGTLLYQLIGLHKIPGQAVTAEISYLQRVGTITALVKLTGKAEWITAWEDIIPILDDLRIRRNDAIHSAWSLVGSEHRKSSVRARGELKFKYETMHTSKLKDLSEEILDLYWKLTQFTVPLLQAGINKIVNQFRPPGWPVYPRSNSQVPNSSRKSQSRNPKRERKRRRRQERSSSVKAP